MFTCAAATRLGGGVRSLAIVRQVLGETFRGRLMSDLCGAYRDLDQCAVQWSRDAT